MRVRTIVICAIATSLLGGAGAMALAPSVAVEPAALECESWQVPGWLDESGTPTGCVDNAPCPEAREGLPCPADVPATVVVPETAPVAPVVAPVAPEPVAVEPEENGACN